MNRALNILKGLAAMKFCISGVGYVGPLGVSFAASFPPSFFITTAGDWLGATDVVAENDQEMVKIFRSTPKKVE